MRGLVCVASRYKVDVDTFHKGIQYALEKLGKSKFRFERTAVSTLKSKRHEVGKSLLIIPELRVFVRTKRHVGSANEIEFEPGFDLLKLVTQTVLRKYGWRGFTVCLTKVFNYDIQKQISDAQF